MDKYALIDMYVPASAGSLEEIRGAAAAAGLDAVVVVADGASEVPGPDELAALASEPGPAVIPACGLLGPSYRLVALVPGQDTEGAYAVLEDAGDLRLLEAALRELGGVALPVCPHQAPDGEVLRRVPPLPFAAAGMVSVVTGGSPLARELDFELAGTARRRLLGGTGPFGQLADIGCYATFLPVDANQIEAVVEVLAAGQGVAVELRPWRPEPGEGEHRGRRHRRRGRSRHGDEGGGDAAGQDDPDGDP